MLSALHSLKRGSCAGQFSTRALLSHTMTGKNRHTSFVNRLNFKSCVSHSVGFQQLLYCESALWSYQPKVDPGRICNSMPALTYRLLLHTSFFIRRIDILVTNSIRRGFMYCTDIVSFFSTMIILSLSITKLQNFNDGMKLFV